MWPEMLKTGLASLALVTVWRNSRYRKSGSRIAIQFEEYIPTASICQNLNLREPRKCHDGLLIACQRRGLSFRFQFTGTEQAVLGRNRTQGQPIRRHLIALCLPRIAAGKSLTTKTINQSCINPYHSEPSSPIILKINLPPLVFPSSCLQGVYMLFPGVAILYEW